MAIILRYVSDFWTLEQRLVRIQLLSKSMTGEEIARELINVLSVTYTIGSDQLIAAVRDRAAVNNVAMRTLAVYPKLLDVGCFSHTSWTTFQNTYSLRVFYILDNAIFT